MKGSSSGTPGATPPAPFVIGFAGGTGSGKTTLAEAVAGAIQGTVTIDHDAYYRHRPELDFEERCQVNYDHPDSLETALLVRHLAALRRGEVAEIPVYDFAAHLRSDRVRVVVAAPVVIVEGILVLDDPDLRALLDLKVYVDTDADVRLARRLLRDMADRGRTAESVIDQYLATVRPMHEAFVEPSKRFADIVIPDHGRIEAVDDLISLVRGRVDGYRRAT